MKCVVVDDYSAIIRFVYEDVRFVFFCVILIKVKRDGSGGTW